MSPATSHLAPGLANRPVQCPRTLTATGDDRLLSVIFREMTVHGVSAELARGALGRVRRGDAAEHLRGLLRDPSRMSSIAATAYLHANGFFKDLPIPALALNPDFSSGSVIEEIGINAVVPDQWSLIV